MNHHDKKLLLRPESVPVSICCRTGRNTEEELPQQNGSGLFGVQTFGQSLQWPVKSEVASRGEE